MKRYISPDAHICFLETENGFMTGSVTDVKIQPAKVTVTPYQDGFADDGGFKDINFD